MDEGKGVGVRASRGRLLLSLYLDFIIFSVPWAFVHHFAFQASSDLQRLSTPAKLIMFAILELLLHRIVKWSPGEWLLSIRRVNVQDVSVAADSASRTAVPFVALNIHARENWFTILVGVFILLEGTKGLVRWMMYTPPTPMFGTQLSGTAWPFVAIAAGAVECVIAYLLLRTRPSALAIAVPYFVFMLASVVTSWNLWDAWAAESVTRRRAYQGIPIREGEISQMQAMTPEILVAGIVFSLIVVAAAGIVLVRRGRRASAVPAVV